MGAEEDERRELRVLEDRAYDLMDIVPLVPVKHLDTTGTFWLLINQIRTSLKILAALREHYHERTRERSARE